MSEDVIIRKAEERDIEQIAIFFEQTQKQHEKYDKVYYESSKDLKSVIKKIIKKQLQTKESLTLVAVNNERVIGYIGAEFKEKSPIHSSKIGRINIENLAVHEDFRGKGVGSKLIRRLEKEVKGKYIISLSVDVENRAVRLYEKHGFKKRKYTMYKLKK